MSIRRELALEANLPEIPTTEAEWEELYHNRAFLKCLREIKVRLLKLQSARPNSEPDIIRHAYEAEGVRQALQVIQLAESDFGRKADNGE